MAKFPSNPKWDNIYLDEKVAIYQNENEDIHMKVKIVGGKSKQFYNETVYSDVPRYLADELGGQYWSVLN